VAGGHKLSVCFSKGGLCLLFLCVAGGAAGQPASVGQDINQIRFESGARALFEERYQSAATIFKDLYEKTKAPRVKLEWARAAFLAKNYDLAKQLFEDVLNEQVPDVVRFNVALYLSEISKLGNQTDYGLSFIRDTNPFAVAKSQQVLIFGIPFNYTPPSAKETLSGINFFLTHSRALVAEGNIRLITDVDATEYEGTNNNKAAAKVAIQIKRNSEDNLSARLGVDHYFQRGELLLRQPYIAVKYRKDQLNSFFSQYELEAKVGRNNYPDFSYVNGSLRSIAASAAKNITNSLQVGASLYLDQTNAETQSQAFKTRAVGLYTRFFTPLIRSSTRLNYARTMRDYKTTDELFLVQREDQRELMSLSIQPYNLKIFGLYPSLEIGVEKFRSNISINSYDRNIVNLSFRKNY